MSRNNYIAVDELLQLQSPRLEDAPAVYALVLKNQQRLAVYMPWANGETTIDDSIYFISEHLDCIAANRPGGLLIWKEEELIGSIGFHHHDAAHRKISLGYWIDADFEGQGIITRSCIVMLNYAFYVLDLNRVTISCAEDNIRSRAVPERLGFANEGTEVDGQMVGNRFFNIVHYRMLEREWREKDFHAKAQRLQEN